MVGLVGDVGYVGGALTLEETENLFHYHCDENECLLATVFPHAHEAAKDLVTPFADLVVEIEKNVESETGVVGLAFGKAGEPVGQTDMTLQGATRVGRAIRRQVPEGRGS